MTMTKKLAYFSKDVKKYTKIKPKPETNHLRCVCVHITVSYNCSTQCRIQVLIIFPLLNKNLAITDRASAAHTICRGHQ